MACVLVVDDERDLVWAVRRSLSDEGYQVLTAYDGLEALAAIRRHHPDLVVLDIVMPRLDGLRVLRTLRRDPALAPIPVLLLTVRSAISDRVKGLDEGSDDYLTKPFDLAELKARVRALLRRGRPAVERGAADDGRSCLVVGPLTLDLGTHRVRAEERDVQLTPTEFNLLCHLMAHPGRVFSSQELLEQVWTYPPETADLGLVRWHIRNLRSKVEPNPACPVYIRTVPRHGYILETHLLPTQPPLPIPHSQGLLPATATQRNPHAQPTQG